MLLDCIARADCHCSSGHSGDGGGGGDQFRINQILKKIIFLQLEKCLYRLHSESI